MHRFFASSSLIAIATAALLSAAPAAIAQTDYCYSHTYSAAHLKKNSKQHIVSIALLLRDDSAPATGDPFAVRLKLRKPTETIVWQGNCAPQKGDSEISTCFLESDGGEFSFGMNDDGKVELAIKRFEVETESSSRALDTNPKADGLLLLNDAGKAPCKGLQKNLGPVSGG